MIAIMSALEFFERLERACPPGALRLVTLEPGQALFRQGDAAPGLPLLTDGRVDLLRHTETGRSVRIHVAHKGETFAEASIFVERCHCDAVAAAASRVRILPKRFVRSAIEAQPDLGEVFSLHLARSLMTARRLLELRAITPLTERALARMSDLADATGALPRTTSLTSIAADLDVTPPALYRAIAALEKRGILSRPDRGRVCLILASEHETPEPEDPT
ncbi:Crp/Fnr family transcriptional regulator [Sulfitobacter sp. D35]|uniref:Crp/Fnr family transcriptional regulator n=1 Tax=Sulfitobacter sp. D35 TaxID=3083252 RepID=UPI00296EB051|nr:Crp/Fnr family transcriptional regulator [Sulfitobacter sp. D35]MDW4497140.1 Crp/Fnr family transcriptional regulator [Sulfitobacter sp. D35]